MKRAEMKNLYIGEGVYLDIDDKYSFTLWTMRGEYKNEGT